MPTYISELHQKLLLLHTKSKYWNELQLKVKNI